MNPKDLFSVVVKSCGFITIFWALQSLVMVVISSNQFAQPQSTLPVLIGQLVLGVATIRWASAIATLCYSGEQED